MDIEEPMDPMDSALPTEPMDRTDPTDPMDRNESFDHKESEEPPTGRDEVFTMCAIISREQQIRHSGDEGLAGFSLVTAAC
ncbi:hypothetical protein [Streptomyces sp. RKAG290]|uniref:hypothetical protein n=1 Tax=Streptomyces sp. RKAG290 TaxID=2888348 RepID=UPI0020334FF0|nr:hypothetical protein [Streptomyces sp. RKAG290]MCM2416345.1 hypothetical protein [Streptomyces sp. RKAG290]